jgi:Flp pilus assembly protein TadG
MIGIGHDSLSNNLGAIMIQQKLSCSRREGLAAVELAILLPLIVFLFVVTLDFSRIFYYSLTVMNCARNGAVYGSDPTGSATLSPYTSIENAALSDAGNLSPQPTITSKTVKTEYSSYIEVTATYAFQTITKYPGIPSTVNLTRTARMRITPATPNFSNGGDD